MKGQWIHHQCFEFEFITNVHHRMNSSPSSLLTWKFGHLILFFSLEIEFHMVTNAHYSKKKIVICGLFNFNAGVKCTKCSLMYDTKLKKKVKMINLLGTIYIAWNVKKIFCINKMRNSHSQLPYFYYYFSNNKNETW